MFKQFKCHTAILAGILCCLNAYATEPTNLQTTKTQLMAYHDSGNYEQDLAAVTYQAADYLRQVVAQNKDKKLAIVFDIDETILSNYTTMEMLNFGGSITEFERMINTRNVPVIPATLALYQQAEQTNVHVFFITGRRDTPENRKNIEQNLRQAGFSHYDGLSLKPVNYHENSVSPYKTAERKKIAAQGYDIVFNMGDQVSDLTGGYADRTYKLPNPYYYVP